MPNAVSNAPWLLQLALDCNGLHFALFQALVYSKMQKRYRASVLCLAPRIELEDCGTESRRDGDLGTTVPERAWKRDAPSLSVSVIGVTGTLGCLVLGRGWSSEKPRLLTIT